MDPTTAFELLKILDSVHARLQSWQIPLVTELYNFDYFLTEFFTLVVLDKKEEKTHKGNSRVHPQKRI